ncbi:MAG: hypothetical protein ACYDGN_14630 [Acidimicrobiales bacterium]
MPLTVEHWCGPHDDPRVGAEEKVRGARPSPPVYLGMDVQLFSEADAFCQEAAGYLAADPFSASVIAVYAGRVRAGSQRQGPADLWATVTDGGRVVGLAMHTPPHRLFLARMPEPAAAALAEALVDQRRTVPGVNGEAAAGASFAAAWQERTGEGAVVDVRMRMYRLDGLKPPVGVAGVHRQASVNDTDLAAEWATANHDEAHPQAPSDDGRPQRPGWGRCARRARLHPAAYAPAWLRLSRHRRGHRGRPRRWG